MSNSALSHPAPNQCVSRETTVPLKGPSRRDPFMTWPLPSVFTMNLSSSWLCAVLAGVAALFIFSACSDSADVGLGVGSESFEGGDPQTDTISAELGTRTEPSVTGREFTPSLTGDTETWRFLVGRVDDPVGGVIKAEGYFGITSPTSIPDWLAEAEANSVSAQLRLVRNYVHGDTTTAVDIEVLTLSEEANMNRARSDTSFPTGSVATDGPAPAAPNDSLVTIDLSDQWIADNLSTLRDTSEEFHGFKLTSGDAEQAVVGFSSSSATLRLLHEEDSTTVDYTSRSSFTHIEREGTPPAHPDHVLLQDGIGVGLEMTLNMDSLEARKNDPLNRAEIFVPVDTFALRANAGSQTFVRPLPEDFRLIATRADGPAPPSCSSVGGTILSEDNEACLLPTNPNAVPGAVHVANAIAFPIFDQTFRRLRNGQSPVFETYRVYVADRESPPSETGNTLQPGLPSTLPALIPETSDPPGLPRATLTVTPL